MHRFWLEQMFDVAFSRRMCCSRACKGEHVAVAPLDVLGPADDAAGHLAHQFLRGGHEAESGAAEADAVADALSVADDDVRAQFAGGLDAAQRQQVGGDDQQGLGGVQLVGQAGQILDHAEEAGRLQQQRRYVALGQLGAQRRAIEPPVLAGQDGQFVAAAPAVGAKHADRLGIDAAGDEKALAARFRGRDHHGFGGGGGAVVHRSVGDFHAGQLADHGLILEDGL